MRLGRPDTSVENCTPLILRNTGQMFCLFIYADLTDYITSDGRNIGG